VVAGRAPDAIEHPVVRGLWVGIVQDR